ncbi:radical SAM protein [Vallitalea sp.]|jgi:radical SAM enzyme (TIGR01210 family)|uniref:radical SAM protein n=1 Tax=Vallitalea sp. TaxID=1882829 RepID=UPI0025D1BE03|nr:radical SAM protein [Vallitalea sp.]MCT4688877.1 hypothetical protein [Vallitalea sp.]
MQNNFLKEITKKIHSERTPLNINQKIYHRHETVDGGVFCEIWFMTKGCKHDREGGCTMCNYGKGHEVADDEIISLIKETLDKLPLPLKQLVISPSGSMFDDEEVSPYLREEIFRLVSEYNCEKFITESRADTLTREKLDKMKNIINHSNIAIELGLESANPWVLKYCINKNLALTDFKNAVDLIKEAGLQVTTNISLGSAFLPEEQAIKDTLSSIKWAFEAGVDTVVVFPIHIKPGTLINAMYKNNMYECISLWSLIDVLQKAHNQFDQRVEISWYKNYYNDKKKIVLSPTTCSKCRKSIIDLLDEYKDTCSSEVIQKLVDIKCDCKTQWQEKISNNKVDTLEQTLNYYEKLAAIFDIDREIQEEIIRDARINSYILNNCE